jgi:hypothetical protein
VKVPPERGRIGADDGGNCGRVSGDFESKLFFPAAAAAAGGRSVREKWDFCWHDTGGLSRRSSHVRFRSREGHECGEAGFVWQPTCGSTTAARLGSFGSLVAH